MQLTELFLKESMSDKEILDVIKALIKAGAVKDGIDWVDYNDDDEPVKGPDNKEGWFNDMSYSLAVKDFDPNVVRYVVPLFWFLSRIINGGTETGRIDTGDAARLVKLVKILKD